MSLLKSPVILLWVSVLFVFFLPPESSLFPLKVYSNPTSWGMPFPVGPLAVPGSHVLLWQKRPSIFTEI